MWVKERPVTPKKNGGLAAAYRDVWDAVRQTRRYPGVLRYLIADYFFEDAAATVIINIGVFSAIVIGMNDSQMTLFLVVTPVAAVFGSFLIGKLAEFWSLKRMLNVIVIGWVIVLTLFVLVNNMTVVWILGSIVGVLLGGLWTVTRPLLAELVPREDLGRFFGLFALSGRAAAVIGPLIWTSVVFAFQPERPLGAATADFLGITGENLERLPYQMAVMSLAGMMLIGLYIFRRVPEPRGETGA
jgi:UMF1 family MFS transporter